MASYSTETPSRSVGLALLIPFVVFVVLLATFSGNTVFGVELPDQAVTGLFGLAALGILASGIIEWREPRRAVEV